jgi:hypothetical protein
LRDQTQPGALPLRPLTTGEVLDAAVVLLRTRAGRLVGLGLLFAFVEQLILFPLRRLADLDDRLLPATGALGIFGVLIVVGFGTEALCISLLGGIAATDAPSALLGPGAPARRTARLDGMLVVGLVGAVVCAASAWSFLVFPVPLQILGLVMAGVVTLVFWPFAYGLLGLSAPAVVIDQLGPLRALGRSLRLTTRTSLRGMWIRVTGYLAWLLIRLGLSLATIAIINLVYSSPSNMVDNLLLGTAWLLVNGLAYPVLGCLDVALHLEIRMRTEGLDIALRRMLRRGVAAGNLGGAERRSNPGGAERHNDVLAVPVRQPK